jgi:hypothetical protein
MLDGIVVQPQGCYHRNGLIYRADGLPTTLCVLFVIARSRRRILHVNVTANPT